MLDLEKIPDLLRSIHSRTEKGWAETGGIAVASHYLKSISPCFSPAGSGGESLCPTQIFKQASPDAWVKSLEKADSTLVYCTNDLLIDSGVTTKDHIVTGGSELTEGSILDFDCVLTSRRKDRDGDILETSGAIPDQNMPLLFNHVAMLPIGKLVTVLEKSSSKLRCKFGIADTSTGRDMAVLTEFGVFRMSHGFKPYKFAPLSDSDKSMGDGRPDGWHIKEFEIFEGSLVPVPANTDGIITGYSRGKLHDPLVKSWAKSFHDGRQKVFAGADFSTKSGQHDCTCGKSHASTANKGASNMSQASGQISNNSPAPASPASPAVTAPTAVGVKDMSQVANAGTVSNTAPVIMDSLAAKPAEGASVQAKPNRVQISGTCPNCGAAWDLTTVPEGMDLSKRTCPICGFGGGGSSDTAGQGQGTKPADLPGSVSDSAINSVNSNTALANANGNQASPKGLTAGSLQLKAGRVLSNTNKTTLMEAHGHMATAAEHAGHAGKHMACCGKSTTTQATKAGADSISSNTSADPTDRTEDAGHANMAQQHLDIIKGHIELAHSKVGAVLSAAAASNDQDNDLTYDENDSIGGKGNTVTAGDKPVVQVQPKKNLTSILAKSNETIASGYSLKYIGSAISSDYLAGSFEWLADELRDHAADYLRSKGATVPYGAYVSVIATFPDRAVLCSRTYSDNDGADRKCWQVGWKMSDAGVPIWDGETKEVVIAPQIIEKALGRLSLKRIANQEVSGAILAGRACGEGAIQSLKSVSRQLATAAESIESSNAESELEEALASLS